MQAGKCVRLFHFRDRYVHVAMYIRMEIEIGHSFVVVSRTSV